MSSFAQMRGHMNASKFTGVSMKNSRDGQKQRRYELIMIRVVFCSLDFISRYYPNPRERQGEINLFLYRAYVYMYMYMYIARALLSLMRVKSKQETNYFVYVYFMSCLSLSSCSLMIPFFVR
jgi:hypothetical protein